MTDAVSPIEVDEFLPHSPAKVWLALTTPSLIERWLMKNDFEPVVGHRFSMQAIPFPLSVSPDSSTAKCSWSSREGD